MGSEARACTGRSPRLEADKRLNMTGDGISGQINLPRGTDRHMVLVFFHLFSGTLSRPVHDAVAAFLGGRRHGIAVARHVAVGRHVRLWGALAAIR